MDGLNQEKVDKFVDSIQSLIHEMDLDVFEICSLLMLVSEKYWNANADGNFIDFVNDLQAHITQRDAE